MSSPNSKKSFDDALPIPTMRDILSPIFRHRWLVIGTFCTLTALTVIFTGGWGSRYYVAKMQIAVEPNRSDPAVTSAQFSSVQNSKSVSTDQISSEIALLHGVDMYREIVATCGMVSDTKWSPGDLFIGPNPERKKAMNLENAALSVAGAVKVEPEKTSNVINVKFGRVGEPEVPACVLQNLSKLYLAKHLALRRPKGASEFFAQQADKYHQDLEKVETELENFSKDEGTAAPDVLRTSMAQQVVNSVGSLYQAKQTLAADEIRLKELSKQ